MQAATHEHGFTLLEIVVVLALIGLTLFFTVPRFGHLASRDPALRASRWILATVAHLKRAAPTDQRTYALQIDVPANRLWVASESDADPSAPSAKGGIELTGQATLLDVEYPAGQAPPSGQTARIRFFPQGYSDRAIIHLAPDGHRRFSFWVEPFLSSARLFETYVGFEE